MNFRASWIGFVLILILLITVLWLIVIRNGHLVWAEIVVMYVCLGLITGVSFWMFTHSSAVVELRSLGIRLIGGAGIGAGFILLLSWLFPIPTSNRLVSIPYGDYLKIDPDLSSNNQLAFFPWEERNQVVVEFLSTSQIEVFPAFTVDKNGQIDTVRIAVFREGRFKIE